MTLDLIAYYQSLLITQWYGFPKAVQTIGALASGVIMPQTSIQVISLSQAPTTGATRLQWQGLTTASLSYNASASTIQSALQAVSGLSQVTVVGSFSSLNITVTFTGVAPPASILSLTSNTLQHSSTPVTATINDIDVTIPIAVQNAFNLSGPSLAQGVQLDVLAKYVGVQRTYPGLSSNITLNDADLYTLMKMAIVKNTSGSDLYTISSLLAQFFGGSIIVTDFKNMNISYLISTGLASANLAQLFVTQDLLPRPMGCAVSVIYGTTGYTFWGCRTYATPNTTGHPLNTYTTYNTTWPWVSYANG